MSAKKKTAKKTAKKTKELSTDSLGQVNGAGSHSFTVAGDGLSGNYTYTTNKGLAASNGMRLPPKF
jgi:hypothetical protein